jgi:hypothetical protein
MIDPREQWTEARRAVAEILLHEAGVEKEMVDRVAFSVVQEVLYVYHPELFKRDEDKNLPLPPFKKS